jgi:iron complex outermembrane receptor protein
MYLTQFLFKGNIARGFRAPSIAEISANGPDPGSQIYHVGDKNFKPEFSLQEDIGAFLRCQIFRPVLSCLTTNFKLHIPAAGLASDGSPVYTQGYTTFTYVQSRARIYGGEVSVDLHPISWLHFENA